MSCDALKFADGREPDLLVEASNIAALVFPEVEFQLLSEKVGNVHASLILPKEQYESLSERIGGSNLSITFKNKKNLGKNINFRVCFFPTVRILTLSSYYPQGMAHLIYTSCDSYNWFDGKGYKINCPDSSGEKLEFLASKFYPFFEEFFLG